MVPIFINMPCRAVYFRLKQTSFASWDLLHCPKCIAVPKPIIKMIKLATKSYCAEVVAPFSDGTKKKLLP